MIQWLYDNRQLPADLYIKSALKLANVDYVKWALANGAKLDQDDIDKIFQYNGLTYKAPMTQWLLDSGFLPSQKAI